jgi:hypothetical protein
LPYEARSLQIVENHDIVFPTPWEKIIGMNFFLCLSFYESLMIGALALTFYFKPSKK